VISPTLPNAMAPQGLLGLSIVFMVNTIKSFPVVHEAHLNVLLIFTFFHYPSNICNVIMGATTLSETIWDLWQFPYGDWSQALYDFQ